MTDNELKNAYTAMLNYAVTLQAADQTSHEIKKALKEKGLTDDALIKKITDESGDIYYTIANKKANKNILWGAVCLVIGLLITLLSYKAGGGKYILAYGAIIGGLIQLVGGLYRKSQL